MQKTHELLNLENLNLIQWNIMDLPTVIGYMYFLFYKAFKYGDGANFWSYVGTNAEQLG
jgi:hypothetical protein